MLSFVSPFEKLHGIPLKLSHLRVFNCLRFGKAVNIHDKFYARIFLGYSHTQKDYKLLNINTKTFYVSRDVIFHETEFPFLKTEQDSRYIFNTTPFLDTFEPPQHDNTNFIPHADNSVDDDFDRTVVIPENPRRSGRTHRAPARQKVFVVSSVYSTAHSINDVFTYDHLQPHYIQFVSTVLNHYEPNSFLEAQKYPNWIAAMKDEITALEQNNTWVIVPLPQGKKPIGCRWIYKIEHHSDDTIERYKTRLVVKGYSQRHMIDYTKTFSPVAKMTTV